MIWREWNLEPRRLLRLYLHVPILPAQTWQAVRQRLSADTEQVLLESYFLYHIECHQTPDSRVRANILVIRRVIEAGLFIYYGRADAA